MPNVNTIERLVGAASPAQGTLAVPVMTLTSSTTETLFTNQLGNTAILLPPGGQLALGTTAPQFGQNLDGFPFRVRAAVKATTGGSSTVVLAIYVGSTIVAGNKVATITSQSLATTSDCGFLEATLIWDNVSQKLKGIQQGQFGTTIVTPAILTGSSGNISVTTMAGLQFVASITMGSSVAASTIALTEFCMEVV